MKIKLEFKPQDLWLGLYWEYKKDFGHAWLCLIPMLPIHFTWESKKFNVKDAKEKLNRLIRSTCVSVHGHELVEDFDVKLYIAMNANETYRTDNKLLTKVTSERIKELQILSLEAGGWFGFKNKKWSFIPTKDYSKIVKNYHNRAVIYSPNFIKAEG